MTTSFRRGPRPQSSTAHGRPLEAWEWWPLRRWRGPRGCVGMVVQRGRHGGGAGCVRLSAGRWSCWAWTVWPGRAWPRSSSVCVRRHGAQDADGVAATCRGPCRNVPQTPWLIPCFSGHPSSAATQRNPRRRAGAPPPPLLRAPPPRRRRASALPDAPPQPAQPRRDPPTSTAAAAAPSCPKHTPAMTTRFS